MSIKLTCKMCTRELEVPDSFAGKRGKCPYCMEVLDIPAAGGETAPAETPSAAEPELRLKPLDEERAVEPGQPIPEPIPAVEQGPAAAAESDRPRLDDRRSKLRLAVLLPAAFVVVGGVIAALILKDVLEVGPSLAPPPVEHADANVTGAETETEHVVQKQGPENRSPSFGLDRFRETRRIAGCLPDNTSAYIEIKQPEKFFDALAGLPIWKDKSKAGEECKAAYNEVVGTLADQFGLDGAVVAGVLKRAHTLHLGFSSLAEHPIIVVNLGEDASRDALFGKDSAPQFSNTLAFNEGVKIIVEQFQGKGAKQLFAGYYSYYAVLATGYDRAYQTLKRLHAEEAGGLLRSAAFTKAIAEREKGASWIYVAPGKALSFLAGNAFAKSLEIDKIEFVQATIDVPANRISGTISARGAVANVLAGSVSGITAAYAPEGASLYVNVSPKSLVDLLALVPYVPFSDGEPAPPVVQHILSALKPEAALVVYGEISASGGAIIIPVADSERLDKAVADHFASAAPVDYKKFKMVSVTDSLSLAFGKDVMIVAGGEATAKRCIDAAASGRNLSKSKALTNAAKDASATVMASTYPLALRAGRSLGKSLATDGTALLSFGKRDGAITFSSDAAGLGVMAAYFSDAAQKRKLARRRSQAAETAQAREICRANAKGIYDAISEFVVKDLETSQYPLLEYPRHMKELIDGGFLQPELLKCPLDDAPKSLGRGIASSYDFLFDQVDYRLSASFSTDAILLWERKPGHNDRHIAVFVDGNVKELAPADLQNAINKAEEDAQRAAPRRVKVPRKKRGKNRSQQIRYVRAASAYGDDGEHRARLHLSPERESPVCTVPDGTRLAVIGQKKITATKWGHWVVYYKVKYRGRELWISSMVTKEGGVSNIPEP